MPNGDGRVTAIELVVTLIVAVAMCAVRFVRKHILRL